MRKLLGRVALLLGVLLVAGAAWWGATTLFEEENDDKADERPTIRGCEAATPRQARAAERAFTREFFDRRSRRWLGGYGVGDTRSLEQLPEHPLQEEPIPEVTGEGSILLVMRLPGSEGPDLPSCIRDVPVVVVTGGPFKPD